MTTGDVEEVARLEQQASSPWSSAMLVDELRRPAGVQYVAVDEESGSVVGWCCGMRTGEEAELLKIAVAKACRRCCLGVQLLLHLENELRQSGVHTLFLEVRARNSAALGLYRKTRFIEVGRRKNYYRTPKDDALLFRKKF